jgi:hypothetical protein
MDNATRNMILGWLNGNHSDANIEELARWMASSLRIGGRKACRALVLEAVSR